MSAVRILVDAGFDWCDVMRLENVLSRERITDERKERVLMGVVELIRRTCNQPAPEPPDPPACLGRQ